MTNEERYIREQIGRSENPFRVPDGYFETLTQRVMQQIPEEETPAVGKPRTSRIVALRPWLYAAACLVVVLVMSLTVAFRQDASGTTLEAQAESATFMDDMVDYAMLDNAEIYACLSDN